ncbi:ATPase, partial [Micromonospora chalcea]
PDDQDQTPEPRRFYRLRAPEDSLRGDLVELGLPMIELPLLPGGVDRAGLEALAETLVRAD